VFVYLVIDELHAMVTFDKVDNFGQHLIAVLNCRTHNSNSKRSPLPKLLLVNLGHGGIKSVSDPLFKTIENLSFILKRPAIADINLDETTHNNQNDA